MDSGKEFAPRLLGKACQNAYGEGADSVARGREFTDGATKALMIRRYIRPNAKRSSGWTVGTLPIAHARP